MAAKNLIRKRSVEKDKVAPQKCPVFSVQYLGKMPARGEYGREYIAEPVDGLLKLKDRHKSPKKSALQITEKGFHFLDFNGAFGKEKHVLIPIHHICYGVADEQNPKVFAIITRTDSNPENSLFECHAFLCDRKKDASEITYWLLRTFLEVFEDLQRRRKIKQERKFFRQQSGGMMGGGPGPAFNNLTPPTSPTESVISPMMYSVILDGSKNKGAAVRLARNPSKNRPVSFPPGGLQHEVDALVPLSGLTNQRQVYNVAGPSRDVGMAYPHPGPGLQQPEGPLSLQGRPTHLGHTMQYPPRLAAEAGDRSAYPQRSSSARNAQDEHFRPQDAVPRYAKNPAHAKSRSSANTSSTDESNSTFLSESFSGVSHREKADFLFIDMLQEEFGPGLDLSPGPPGAGPPTFARRFNMKKGPKGAGPPDQKLRSEDIEKRVREWLEYEEGEDVSVFSPPKSPNAHWSPATSIRSPAGYNPGYIYQNVGYRDDNMASHGGRRTLESQSSAASASDKDYF